MRWKSLTHASSHHTHKHQHTQHPTQPPYHTHTTASTHIVYLGCFVQVLADESWFCRVDVNFRSQILLKMPTSVWNCEIFETMKHSQNFTKLQLASHDSTLYLHPVPMLSIWDVAGGRIRARPVSPLRSRKAAQNKSREEARRRRGAPGNDAGSKGKGNGKEGPSSRLFNLTPQHLVVPPREQGPEVAMAPAHLQWSLAEDRWLTDCWYVPSLLRQFHPQPSLTHTTQQQVQASSNH